jgi:hypothetical protein
LAKQSVATDIARLTGDPITKSKNKNKKKRSADKKKQPKSQSALALYILKRITEDGAKHKLTPKNVDRIDKLMDDAEAKKGSEKAAHLLQLCIAVLDKIVGLSTDPVSFELYKHVTRTIATKKVRELM